MPDAPISYEKKKRRLCESMSAAHADRTFALGKNTSNLFRDRQNTNKQLLDVRDFDQVLEVNTEQGWVDVEGMTPYDALVDATLNFRAMPAVVPQLKSITIGGAVSGIGIESSSFRYGLVHETIEEMDVLLADGSVIQVTPNNEHKDLFFAFPNSYGTLGYALKLRVKTIPVKPFVRLSHIRHYDFESFFADIERRCASDADFVDGVVFGPKQLYISEGRFVEDASFVSDYSFEHIYYRSIEEKTTDYLTTRDYLWRWDTDWFWCSKHLGMQNPWIRKIAGRERCNSRFYTRLMRWNSRWGFTRTLDRLAGLHRESVIQDVDIPISNAPSFLDFFLQQVRILPIWVCPTRKRFPDAEFTLFPMKPDALYVNFGFWDVVKRRCPFPEGHHNRMVERKVASLGGIKSLYSDSYYDADTFWRIYNGPQYTALKLRYDPERRFKDLYEKCVLRG